VIEVLRNADTLSSLKTRATLAHRHGKGVGVDASMVLALVECVKAAKDMNSFMTKGGVGSQAEVIAFNELHDAVTNAIAKLEAL
jgi:hypothetical protein